MVKAVFNGVVIAESAKTELVEGNHYFPPASIKQEYFTDSALTTRCGWKGLANYKNVKVGDKELKSVCWYYANPSDAAQKIKGHFAFYKYKGIDIE